MGRTKEEEIGIRREIGVCRDKRTSPYPSVYRFLHVRWGKPSNAVIPTSSRGRGVKKEKDLQ